MQKQKIIQKESVFSKAGFYLDHCDDDDDHDDDDDGGVWQWGRYLAGAGGAVILCEAGAVFMNFAVEQAAS